MRRKSDPRRTWKAIQLRRIFYETTTSTTTPTKGSINSVVGKAIAIQYLFVEILVTVPVQRGNAWWTSLLAEEMNSPEGEVVFAHYSQLSVSSLQVLFEQENNNGWLVRRRLQTRKMNLATTFVGFHDMLHPFATFNPIRHRSFSVSHSHLTRFQLRSWETTPVFKRILSKGLREDKSLPTEAFHATHTHHSSHLQSYAGRGGKPIGKKWLDRVELDWIGLSWITSALLLQTNIQVFVVWILQKERTNWRSPSIQHDSVMLEKAAKLLAQTRFSLPFVSDWEMNLIHWWQTPSIDHNGGKSPILKYNTQIEHAKHNADQLLAIARNTYPDKMIMNEIMTTI